MSQRSTGKNWIIYTTASGDVLTVDQVEQHQSAIWWFGGVARGEICPLLESDLRACAARVKLLVLALKDVSHISSECLQMLVRLQKDVLDANDGELRLVNAQGTVAEKLTQMRIHLALNVTQESLEQPKTDRPAVEASAVKAVPPLMPTDYEVMKQPPVVRVETPEARQKAEPGDTLWMLIDCRNGTIHRGSTREVLIGRRADCDVVLPMQSISRTHLKMTFRDGKWWAEEQGSSYGTRLDGQPVTANAPVALARHTAAFELSRYAFDWASGPCCALIDAQQPTEGPVGKLVHEASGEAVCIVGNQMKLGRRYMPQGVQWNCSQVVSGEHAEIRRAQDGWYLTDLKSRNGTYLDDVQLTAETPAKLRDGARIRLGSEERGEKFRWVEGRGEDT